MGLDYLDCYLLHWRGDVPLGETMRALERLVRDGKTRSLGVSNFAVDDLEEAQAVLESQPIACNQVLYHLGERTIEAHELPWCRERGIAVVAYTPFGRGDWSDRPGAHELERVARKHGATVRGRSLSDAVKLAHRLEISCRHYVLARVLGEPRQLTEEEWADFHRRVGNTGYGRPA